MTAVDHAATRRDPHYQGFVAALAEMVRDQMERDGTLPEWLRRPEDRPPRREDEGKEAA